MKKVLTTIVIGLLCFSMFSVLAPKVTASSDLLSLPAAPYGWQYADSSHNSLMTNPLAGPLISVSQQSITASPSQTVSVSVTYQVFAQSPPNNPNEIDQLFFVESWTISWPPQGYTIPLYNGIPGLNPGVTQTSTITFTVPSVSGTYYLWLCFEAQYSMQDAVNQRTQPMTGLPGHLKVVVTPTAGPVGYWKFDEGSGTTAADSSGDGNTGTLVNGPQWIDGKVGKALEFNGVSYVSVPDSPSLDISGNQISVEFWVKFDKNIDGSTPYMKFYDKGNAYNSAVGSGGIRFTFWIAGDSSANLDSTTKSFLAGVWYHIAEVYDGSKMSIYINGALDNSMSMFGNIASTSYPVAIAAYTLGGQWYLQGAMDEVKIYNYARTAEEIMNDFLCGNAEVHFVSITLNRSPGETTQKGAEIAENPSIEYYGWMPSLGVWAKVIVDNPTSNDFYGVFQTSLIDSSGIEHKISSPSFHVSALSESTFYLPIYATFTNPIGMLTIRFQIIQDSSSGTVVDEKEMQLEIESSAISGPKLPAYGNLIELQELLQPDLSYYAYQNVAAWLDALKEVASTAASLMTGMEQEPVGDFLPAMPIKDLGTICSILSRTTTEGIQIDLESHSQGTCTYRITASYANWPVYNAYTLEGNQYDFFMWYDRVVTIVKVPSGLTITNDGSADLKITDGSTTYLLFVDNYVDKMLSYGNTGTHQIEVSCPETASQEVEASSYFMIGPYYPSAKTSDFPINDYNVWNSNPEEVYWVLCAANQASATASLPWWSNVLSGAISQGQTVVSQYVAKTSQALAEFQLTWPGSVLDLHVYDQSGRHVGMNYTSGLVDLGIPGSEYYNFGSNTELIRLSFPQPGNYTIEIFGKQVNSAEQFTLTIREASLIKAQVNLDPTSLNLGSKGTWVTAYIEITKSFDLHNINVSSILLNNTIPVALSAPVTIGDYDNDGIPDLMVKFDRAKVVQYVLDNVPNGGRFVTVTFIMTGKLYDGTPFQGSDTMSVISPTPARAPKPSYGRVPPPL
jgi:hypothetical protein